MTNQIEKLEDHEFESLLSLRRALREFLRQKEDLADSTLCALLAKGHILIEDVPGVGKTTLIRAIAKLLGLKMKRIQFTADLLPSDIIGIEVFDQQTRTFEFHEGPIFANIILADELNRASPRTQSALLEAMGEGSVTVDRKTHILPRPFFVVAAQNPSDHHGTYPIPESQKDRFTIKLKLDYPSLEKEIEILKTSSLDPLKDSISPIVFIEQLLKAQQQVEKIHVSNEVAVYIKKIIDATRTLKEIKLGISTRGGILWTRMAKALAFINKRDYVIPDDLLNVAMYCLPHRIVTVTENSSQRILNEILNNTEIHG